MSERLNIARASDLLEACAFDPGNVEQTFDRVCDALNLRFFHLTNLSGTTPEHLTGERSKAAVDEYIRSGVFEQDAWTQAALSARPRHNELQIDRTLVPDTSRNGAYYRDYCPRHDVAYHGGWVNNDGYGDIHFAIFRSAKQGDFNAGEQLQLSKLIPAANRAIRLMVAMRQHRVDSLADGLDAAGKPCLIVDNGGRITHVTPGAEAVFDHTFGVRAGALFAEDPNSHRNLALITAASQGRIDSSLLPNIIIKRGEKSPLLLELSPIRGVGLDALPGARLLVKLIDLSRNVQLNRNGVRSIFQMTPSEIEVAALLVNGYSVERIAADRRVQLSSVRQLIKGMLAKSNTHRQAELVALLHKFAG